MKEKTKIAFVHNSITQNTQKIMSGITDYVKAKTNWQLIVWPDSSLESLAFLKRRNCKGAFVSVQTSTKAQQILDIGMPVVAFSTLQAMHSLPYISSDSEKVAQTAYEYFVRRRFTNFAFFGLTEARWSLERMNHFARCAAADERKLYIYEGGLIPLANDLVPFNQLWIGMTLNHGQQGLVDWLKQLPKPVAILVSCDILACYLINTAREAGLAIPEDIAILGVDNDEAVCTICDPPLSSISFNLNKAGYDAAALLDAIISGRDILSGQCIRMQPAEVKSRGSTDIFAVEDPDMVQALKFIHDNRTLAMQVDDIARHLCISKRSLQMKFRKTLGRSIHDEIVHAHYDIARALLIDTDLPLDTIAARAGFNSTTNMRRAFKELTGQLPHLWRDAHRSA